MTTTNEFDYLMGEIEAALEVEAKPAGTVRVAKTPEPTLKPAYTIGIDRVELDLDGLSDTEVLQAASAQFPQGVLLYGAGLGPVWLHPRVLAGSAHLDGFGLETQGIVACAVDLLKLASDPMLAEDYGDAAVRRLMKSFIGQARERSVSKKTNQLHAVRVGVASKVVLSDRTDPGVIEVHPDGAVAQRLHQAAKKAGAEYVTDEVDSIEYLYVAVERHPFVLPYVAQIRFNRFLTRSLTMANRMEFRGTNRGDADGDTLNMFVIPTLALGRAMRDELRGAVDGVLCRGGAKIVDAAYAIRGVAIAQDADTWAENIFADGKTVEKKMTQSFTKSCDEWLSAHAKMADYANKYTPFAYRISDIGASMAGLGIEHARTVSLLGATIEEDFYLGLSGGPAGLDAAMETWFRERLQAKTIKVVMDGLRKVVRPDLLTTDVKIALIEAGRINQYRLDLANPLDVFTHLAWLVGKGRTSLGANRAPEIMSVLDAINKLAGTDEVAEARERFLVRMGSCAASVLYPILDAKRELGDEDDDWEPSTRSSVDQDADVYAFGW